MIEVILDPFELAFTGFEAFVGLEVAPIAEDRVSLVPALLFELIKRLPANLGAIEQLETRDRPVEDFF